MKVREVFTQQIAVFESDVLPLLLLGSGKTASEFATEFEFRDIEPLAADGALTSLTFRRGLLPGADHPVAISHVTVEARRVGVRVAGDDLEAADLLPRILAFLSRLRPALDPGRLTPIVQSVETVCVCDLDIDFNRLFSQKARGFVRNDLGPACQSEYGTAVMFPTRIAFQIEYEPTNAVSEAGATLASREFTLEMRADTRPGARVFFAKAPVPFSEMAPLLERLEAIAPAR